MKQNERRDIPVWEYTLANLLGSFVHLPTAIVILIVVRSADGPWWAALGFGLVVMEVNGYAWAQRQLDQGES